MNPLVSIVVTSYNHSQYISKALDSVLAQSYKNIEIIVIDDASTDGSQKIIKKYQQQHRFTFIERDSNYYSAEKKNGDKPIIEAMLAARGKYIAVVDSDDYIKTDKISSQVALLEKNPDASLCYGGIQVIMPDNKRLKYIEKFFNGDHFNYLLISGNPLLYIGCLIRSSSFHSIGRSRDHIQQEDWDMFLRLAKCGPFVSDKKTVACYRRHANNSWFRKDREQLMYLNRFRILDEWKNESAWPDAMNIRWQQYTNQALLDEPSVDALLMQRPEDALLHYLKSKFLSDNIISAVGMMHLSMAILYCDDRLQILPKLYSIKLNFLNNEEEKINLLYEIKSRLRSHMNDM